MTMPFEKMKDSAASYHANAVNLARRWTVKNENDLLQENFYEGNDFDDMGEQKSYDYNYCHGLAQHLMHPKSLPAECAKYSDIMMDLKRRDTDSTHPSQLLS